jgi:oligopeptidase A
MKERFAQIQEEQAALSQKVSENVLDATDAWFHLCPLEELEGVPEEVQSNPRVIQAYLGLGASDE